MSPTVQEVLFTVELAKAPITLENVDWEDAAKRNYFFIIYLNVSKCKCYLSNNNRN